MAEAPGHRLGQIVGSTLEEAVKPVLGRIASEHNLYLDSQGERAARRGKKVTWADVYGNLHDLDFVLERGGTNEKLGIPAAFIETAWRRYTKHSRNKAQEIEGALIPLRSKHSQVRPFLGAVLAGDFTKGSLDQLRSNGFAIAHIRTDVVVKAFAEFGIDIGSAENTPDKYLADQVEKFESLDPARHLLLEEEVRRQGAAELSAFAEQVKVAIMRRVERVTIVALHGRTEEFAAIADAIRAIREYRNKEQDLPFLRFEVSVRYSNADRITAEFGEVRTAIEFLESFQSPLMASTREVGRPEIPR